MKKKRILSLALATAFIISNSSVVLATNPQNGAINGVSVTGSLSAYYSSGMATTYMGVYTPSVRVSVDARYRTVDLTTGDANDWQRSSNAGDSSASVFFQAPPNSKTTVMHAHHTASNGNQTWEADTDTTY